MRILHIDPDDIDNPLSGGGPIRTHEIYRRLAQRHEITVLTPTFAGSTPELRRDGVRYIRLGRKIGRHGSSHHITFFFSLAAAIRRYPHDVLVEDFMPPASATYLPLFSRAPLIASVQWFFAAQLAKQYHLPFTLGERYGVKLYRNFVVLTQDMQSTILKRNRNANCAVIPNAVEPSLFQIVPQYGDFILYLGRVDCDQKGVDLLLQAYALLSLAERLPLLLAGHGYQWPQLQALIDRLQLQASVKILGKVDLAQKTELLKTCRFVCVPSRSETFGMVILEACAAAKPVVLFDRAPMNEVAPSGLCEKVEPFNPAAYAQAMRKLLQQDQSALAERGAECRAWVRHYNWNDLALQQERFYLQVLERSKSSPAPRKALE